MIRTSWQKVTAISFFAGLVLLVYLQVLNFGFSNIDDSVYVTQNPHVLSGLSLEGIRWAMTSTFAGFWHPLTWLSLMLDAQIFGAWAGGYHLTNLLLHVASSLLLFIFFNRSTGSFWRSGFAAALFALHPLHVESVAWVGERKDVLSAFFWMLTLCAYVYYTETVSIKRYLIVLLFFFMGLMSKPMLVTLPFVLILLDYWPLNRISHDHRGLLSKFLPDNKGRVVFSGVSVRRVILEKIPFFIFIIPVSIATFLAEKKFGALPSAESFPPDMRIYNALISYVRYIGKTIFPTDLSIYYPHPGMWPAWQVILAAAMLVLLTVWFARKMNRNPYLMVGWLWYLGTLVPVIGFIQVGPSSIADRYTYIPIIGLFIMLAWGFPDFMRRLPNAKAWLAGGTLIVLIILSVLSWQRCRLWGDNYLLWDDVLKKYNISSVGQGKEKHHIAFAYNFRGIGHAEKGRYREAIEDYNTALRINRKYSEALNNRATAYAATGRQELALRDLSQLIEYHPKFASAYYNRGLLRLNMGDLDQAIDDFSEAIRIDKGLADAFNNRGVAFRMKGQYAKAFADFNQALSINTNLAEAYCNRGIIFQIHRQFMPAMKDFTQAVRIKPDYADAYYYRAALLADFRLADQAIGDLQKTLNIQPDHLPALQRLAGLLEKTKKDKEAAEQYQRILRINPDNREALENLSRIQKRQRSESR